MRMKRKETTRMAESGEQVVVYHREDGPRPEVYLITVQRV
jgi:hypothetical protein